MSDRPPELVRKGPFVDEDPTGPRHPASPPLDEPEVLDSRSAADDKARPLAETLRDLIQSLPRRPGASPLHTSAQPVGISGVVMSALDDRTSDEQRSHSGEDSPESEPIAVGNNLIGPTSEAHYGSTEANCPQPFGADSGGEVVALPSRASITGDTLGSLAGYPAVSRPPVSFEDAIIDATSSVKRADETGSPEVGSVERPHYVMAESSAMSAVADAVTATVESHVALGSRVPIPDRAASRGMAPTAGLVPETIGVGPVGPVARDDEGFDRSSIGSIAGASWGESVGRDLIGESPRSTSASDEGQAGVDLSATNTLLGQILDELRRHTWSAPIASARAIYPER